MNSTKIIGRLAQDPEARYTKTGKAVTSFTVAVSRNTAPGQEQKDSADFIPIVAWGNLAEMCGNSLCKGQKVFVEGRLQVRSYETSDGQKRRITEGVASFVAQSMESDKGMGSNTTADNSKADFGEFSEDVTDEENKKNGSAAMCGAITKAGKKCTNTAGFRTHHQGEGRCFRHED